MSRAREWSPRARQSGLVSTVDVNASRMVVGLKSAPIGQKRSCENARDIADFIHRPCRAANYFSNFACAWRIDRLRVAFASYRELDRAAKKADRAAAKR